MGLAHFCVSSEVRREKGKKIPTKRSLAGDENYWKKTDFSLPTGVFGGAGRGARKRII